MPRGVESKTCNGKPHSSAGRRARALGKRARGRGFESPCGTNQNRNNMEIKIEVNDGVSFTPIKVDISLYNMDAAMLSSLNGDEIRDMARPMIENKLFLENGNRETSRKLSYLLVYGKERCRESFPWLFDNEQESEPSRSAQ